MHDRNHRAVTQCVDSADVMAAVAAGRDGGSTWRFVVAAPFNFLESRTLAREDLYEKSCSEKLCSCCCDYTRCQRSRAGARERSLGRLGGECDNYRWLQLPHAVSVYLRIARHSRLGRDPRACGTQVLLLQRGVSR